MINSPTDCHNFFQPKHLCVYIGGRGEGGVGGLGGQSTFVRTSKKTSSAFKSLWSYCLILNPARLDEVCCLSKKAKFDLNMQ